MAKLIKRLLAALVLAARSAAQAFENSAIVRTIEPGGALTAVTTTYAVKVLEENPAAYLITLSKAEGKRTALLEARLKGSSETLRVVPQGTQMSVLCCCWCVGWVGCPVLS